MTITNVTESTHEFCCGSVTLQISAGVDGIYLNVTGAGSNPTWWNRTFNYVAALWFPGVTAPLISYRIDYTYYQQTGNWPRGSMFPPPGSEPAVPRL